jgi:hypothetical protein
MARFSIWMLVAAAVGLVAVASFGPGVLPGRQSSGVGLNALAHAPAALAATALQPRQAPPPINGVIDENVPPTPTVTPSVAAAPQPQVITVRISPYNDASVDSGGLWAPDQNLGGWSQLAAGPQQGGTLRSYLRFLVGGLPAGMQIDSALLILTPMAGGTHAVPIEADYVIDPWNESTITWNQQPLSTFRSGTATWQPNNTDPVTIDVTSAALQWYACGGTANNGLLLSADLAPDWVSFGSRKSQSPPMLQVTYQTAAAPVNCAAPPTSNVNLTSPSGVTSSTTGAQSGAQVIGTPINPNPRPVPPPTGSGSGGSAPSIGSGSGTTGQIP